MDSVYDVKGFEADFSEFYGFSRTPKMPCFAEKAKEGAVLGLNVVGTLGIGTTTFELPKITCSNVVVCSDLAPTTIEA